MKESRGLAEAGTDQIKLRGRGENLRTGKYNRAGYRKGRQKNCLSDKKGYDEKMALLQPNHDPGGVIAWVRRQKHAGNRKQQQDDNPGLKELLHLLIIAPY